MIVIDYRTYRLFAWRFGVIAAIFGLAALFVVTAWQTDPVPVTSDRSLIRSIGYMADPTGKMLIQEVAAADFIEAKQVITRGYTRDTHWVRLVLAPNLTHEPLILTIGVPNLDEVTLFERGPGSGWTSSLSGDRLPYAARPWQSQQIGFQLADQQGASRPRAGNVIEAQPIYLRVRTTGTSAMLVNVAPASQVYSDQARMGVIHALFYALMITALTVAVGLYVYSGDGILLWFVASQSVYTLMTVSFAGYISVILPMTPTHQLTSVLTIASGLFNTLFHLQLLHRFEPARAMQRIGKAVVAIQIASLLLNLLYDDLASLAISMVLTNFFMLFLAVMAYTARTSAHLSLRSLRAVYTVYGLSIVIWILPAVGIGPSGRLSIYAVLVQGLVNLVLVLSMLGFLAVRTRAAVQAAQARLAVLNQEAEIQAQSALAQRNLTWMLAHEVATSLSIIRLAVSKEPLSPRNATRIDRAVSGLDHVMQHCLDAGRIHAGKWQPTPSRCDLVAVVNAALSQFETDGHTIVLQLPPQAPIYSDPDLVRLTFAHIIDNALKYAPTGTKIELVLDAGPMGYRFAVQNRHGAGGPPDVGRVFTKFYRDDRVLAQRGTGLGLFIVREVVNALGGRVDMAVSNGVVTAQIELGNML